MKGRALQAEHGRAENKSPAKNETILHDPIGGHDLFPHANN